MVLKKAVNIVLFRRSEFSSLRDHLTDQLVTARTRRRLVGLHQLASGDLMAELNADGVVIKVQLDAVRNSAETTSVPPESSSVRDDNIVAESNEVSGLAAPAIVFPEIKYTSTNVTTTSGGRPYSSFSSGEKWFIVVLSAVAGTFSSVRLTLT